jgi:hypothetical protein
MLLSESCAWRPRKNKNQKQNYIAAAVGAHDHPSFENFEAFLLGCFSELDACVKQNFFNLAIFTIGSFDVFSKLQGSLLRALS